MAQRRFKVGDRVRIQDGAGANRGEAFHDAIAHDRPGGIFEVIACLPDVDGVAQYRIRGGDDRGKRIVRESQLVSAVRSPQPRR